MQPPEGASKPKRRTRASKGGSKASAAAAAQDEGDSSSMAVYDFDADLGGDDLGDDAAVDALAIDDPNKERVAKVTARKSQQVTQAHMCNYCNYTTPKRYLLSRHMKSHSEVRAS